MALADTAIRNAKSREKPDMVADAQGFYRLANPTAANSGASDIALAAWSESWRRDWRLDRRIYDVSDRYKENISHFDSGWLCRCVGSMGGLIRTVTRPPAHAIFPSAPIAHRG